ncbi:TolC family protein [Zooshikella ganghwensis]|uniref:TolC family protein n=1 Tax=Zooshikella ganghwensis TaxID=202772 RepID=A0A4P9VKI9_9GAMM|nr:TolC family protein [Zooshikella ganghwensis]RDH42680.1 TolC family protein [Zooshikella ganghwensis]
MLKSNKVVHLQLSSLFIAIAGCSIQPVPFTEQEHSARITENQHALATQQIEINGILTLEEAFQRALKYNLDKRVAMMEGVLASKELEAAKYELLPDLLTKAGFNHRTNIDGSSSRSIDTGQETLEPSTSTQRDVGEASLELSWNVLDFGLSYIRAKQQADRYLLAKEQIRKMSQQILLDVRAAYWRAVAQQRIMDYIEPILARAEKAYDNTEQIRKKRLQSPYKTLVYQRDLLTIIRELHILRKNILHSKAELAKLINVSPSAKFRVAVPNPEELSIPAMAMSIEQLEQHGIRYRPELIGEAYKERISAAEAKAALLELLPSLKLKAGGYYNSNDFLVNQNWGNLGLDLSYNLMGLFAGNKRKESAELAVEISKARRLAMHMSVLAQVHVSWQSYQQAIKEFESAQQFDHVELRIVKHLRANAQKAKIGKNEVLRAELNYLLGQLRRDLSYADVQYSYGQLLLAAGMEPLENSPELTKADINKQSNQLITQIYY